MDSKLVAVDAVEATLLDSSLDEQERSSCSGNARKMPPLIGGVKLIQGPTMQPTWYWRIDDKAVEEW